MGFKKKKILTNLKIYFYLIFSNKIWGHRLIFDGHMPRTGYVANAIYINLALIALKTNLFKFSTHDYFFSSEDRRLLLYVIDNQ